MEDHTGFKSKLPSLVENIPFCGNDTINEDTTPKINVTEGGCCFAFKEEHLDEETGESVWFNRFGGSNEPEQPWFDNTCGKTEPGYVCEYGHINGSGYDQDATVCHCFESLCNLEVREMSTLPEPTGITTTPKTIPTTTTLDQWTETLEPTGSPKSTLSKASSPLPNHQLLFDFCVAINVLFIFSR